MSKNSESQERQRVRRALATDNGELGMYPMGEWGVLRGLCLIAACAFVLMSILNLVQGSRTMLVATFISAAALFAAVAFASSTRNIRLLRVAISSVAAVMFTFFIAIGGNDGFAALWIVLVPYIGMVVVGLRFGWWLSMYFMVLLIALFYTPLGGIMTYNYGTTFMLRFPLLYMISFACATFVSVRLRASCYVSFKQSKQLERASSVDSLTDLLNSNQFTKYVETFDPLCHPHLSVVYADLNGLHEYNKTHGHSAGDKMLEDVSALMKQCFAPHDCYRVGGDEFVVICESEKPDRVNRMIGDYRKRVDNAGYSVSCGMATLEEGESLKEALNRADRRMFDQKSRHYCRIEFDRRTPRSED